MFVWNGARGGGGEALFKIECEMGNPKEVELLKLLMFCEGNGWLWII